VLTLQPDEVIQYFDKQIIQETSTETAMKGYWIKIEYNTPTSEEING